MERFHIITLVVASVSLILVLTIAGILLTKVKHSQKFPTSHKDVPDGWERSGVGPLGAETGYTLTHTSGTNGDTAEKTFTNAEWDDICIKKAWAVQSNVYWDGITTYNGC